MKTMPTVLVVEDEPAIAELVAVNLRHNGFRPLWAMDSDSAQREMDAAVPDLVLLDWMLPGDSGLTLAKRWRADKRSAEVPIIMVTAKGDERDRVSGLDAGADDYITKPFSTKELLARVRAVLRRKAPVSAQEPLGLGALSLDPATHRVALGTQALRLGPTEFKLLQYLMAHPERVHSRGQLLDKVWGDHVYIEERTVDVHVKRLRESLGDGAAMLETVRGVGYRLTAQPVAAAAAPARLGLA
ncbi:MAG: phosphate regulon transcriptional regulator PhoB [Rhodoferax sp.]